MKKTLFILFILSFCAQLISAQNLKKANYLFEKNAYLNAAELFLNETDKNQEVLEKLGDCYYFNSKMTDAVYWYQQLIKSYENSIQPTYFFRYSQALKGIKKFNEADKWYKIYVNKKQPNTFNNQSTVQFIKDLKEQNTETYLLTDVAINSVYSDFGASYFGDKIVFASNRNQGKNFEWNNLPYLDLFQVDIDQLNDSSKVTPFSETINTKLHESNAVFTSDGKTMYFTRNNFINGKKGKDADKITHLKIYKAELLNNEWTNIVELPFNGTNYSVEHPALSSNEKQLYFASDMPGTIGSFDIFVVDIFDDGSYSSPKNLGPTINTEHREQFPFMSAENELYFASNGHFGIGGLDIFKSELTENGFAKPINLGEPINSNLDDFAFIINTKNNSGFISSNRLNGASNDDIYSFTYKKSIFVTGIVQNKNSLELLPGTLVTLYNSSNKIINEITVGENASYSFEIEPNTTYKLKGSLKLFNPTTIEFYTDNKGNINKNILLHLESYEDAEKNIIVDNGKTQIKINPIYFDFNKWNIRPDAAIELNNVVSIMKKYPDMVIEIGAHTDARGTEKYNLELSHKRAKSVREYLVSQGISNNNVKSVGYGETQPLNNCTKPGMCKSEAYDINRRCEFIILN
ncbi:OmpA family protein [Lutibacter maritimus]|uniref:WD40-like Beta Propeller Repeat n=1 Tax=Lutibacter maritimus TaxID=593133 RepID=A0A1I6R6T9_9FLAO|nr:OmpA family protein [Lutibacter maritimus]SFS60248.1 WD40-like Beta Propeller Repeat [Lutibacter maritimus]